MNAKIGYFVGGLAAVSLGFLALAQGQRNRDVRQGVEARGLLIGRSLAWAFAEEYEREDAPELAAGFAAASGAAIPGLSQGLVLKGTRFVVHTDEAKAGERLDRDSVEDKALYDTAARIKANTRKNDEERAKEPPPARASYPEEELSRSQGKLTWFVPAKVDGRYKALASVTVSSRAPTAPLPHGVLLIMLAAVALFGLIAWKIDGLAAHGAGSVVILGAVVLQAGLLLQWRDDLRRSDARQEAATLSALAGSGLYAGADADGLERAVKLYDVDRAGAPRGRLLETRTATAAATRQGVDFEVDGHVTTYAASWFDAQREDDAEGLARWSALFGILGLLLFNLGLAGRLYRAYRSLVAHRGAYAYMAPAALGMLVLVFVPVTYGIVLGFMQRRYNEFEFAGLSNYLAILGDFDVSRPDNFYFTLGVTILWTFTNVVLHVGIGLFFALLLNDKLLKARGLFRVLLIVPWAVPNYITALIWKGMFHRQFGVVNHLLQGVGLEPVSWFQTFWPAFSTNVVTNTWLGFPFMMVVSLGALQSIPSDLYEAAIVDGASRWQRFVNITLPLLMPALVPAVVVGTVWTFNMFNIIYLVSGGAPNGSTDILITEAFRWAFERDRYGYAAAYSTVIFLVLLVFTVTTNRITNATKGAFE